jgi:hypothetical protein
MHKLITVAIAVTMTSLFAAMFWGKVGLITINDAVARPITKSYAVMPNPYLPIVY